jgi:hypothetical protein
MLNATAAKRRPRHTRTGISLPRSDGRTIAARRFRELVESFEKELGGKLSEVDQSLVRQAANLVQVSERLQADVIAGAQVDADAMVRISSEARRILGMLAPRPLGTNHRAHHCRNTSRARRQRRPLTRRRRTSRHDPPNRDRDR